MKTIGHRAITKESKDMKTHSERKNGAVSDGHVPQGEDEKNISTSPADAHPVSAEVVENQRIYDEHLDLAYAYSISRRILKRINHYYFRVRFVGFDDFPDRNNPERPLIFASNHSGMAFPWDAIVFCSALFEKFGYQKEKAVRAITSPMLSQARFMSPFLIKDFWKRLGAIDATRLNFETMMYYKEADVLIYPEGVPGIGKGFNNKYHLQKLSSSSLRMSIKYRTDIVPFATVNAEYINPLSYSIAWLNELVQKIGVPFLPLGPMLLLIPLQPWIFYFALPAQLTFVRGRRIRPYEMVDKPYEELTEEEIHQLRDQIQQQMQEELDWAVAQYGQDPYGWKAFFRTMIFNASKLLSFMPVMWPLLFVAHEREYNRLRRLVERIEGRQLPAEELTEKLELLYEKEQKEISIGSLVETVIENPAILLLYTPVAGLFSMFMSRDK